MIEGFACFGLPSTITLSHMTMARIRPKHILEYAVLRVADAIVQVLPYRAALFLAWLHAWPSHFIFQFRRKEAKRRIRQVFGDETSEARVNRIAWISWRNTLFNAVDMMRISRLSREWIDRNVSWSEMRDALLEHRKTGQGAVLALPHMGAWDLAATVGISWGIPLFSVAGRQRNPLTNRYISKLRLSGGIETLERGDGTMKQVFRRLRAGGFFAVLPDVRMRTPDIEVPFLGGTANLGRGMAVFARKVGVPVFTCAAVRRGWTGHVINSFATIRSDESLDKNADVMRMTRQIACIIDDAIRREPEQWFWYNKRWVLDPLE